MGLRALATVDVLARLARGALERFQWTASGRWLMTGAARQVHLFNIPFGVARESNSLHSKRMKNLRIRRTRIFNEPVDSTEPASTNDESSFSVEILPNERRSKRCNARRARCGRAI